MTIPRLGSAAVACAVVLAAPLGARAHDFYEPTSQPPAVQTDLGTVTQINASRQGGTLRIQLQLSPNPPEPGKPLPDDPRCSTLFLAFAPGTPWQFSVAHVQAGQVIGSNSVDVDVSQASHTFDFDVAWPTTLSAFPATGNWTIYSHTSGFDPDHEVQVNGVRYFPHCHGIQQMPGDDVPRATSTQLMRLAPREGIVDDHFPRLVIPELQGPPDVRNEPGRPGRVDPEANRRMLRPQTSPGAKRLSPDGEPGEAAKDKSEAPSASRSEPPEAAPSTKPRRAPATPR